MAEQSLKDKTKKSFIWSAIDNFSAQAIQFILGIILARILEPSDYGIIGMLSIFLAMSNSIVNGGFVHALIQKKDCSQADYSTVFIINAILGIVFYCIMFIAAPLIASFYNFPILTPVTRVLSLTIIFNSLVIVQTARLTKELNFKLQAKIRFICGLITGMVAILLAYLGAGFWALVFQALSSAGLSCVLFWGYSKWKPSLLFSVKSFKRLFSFGSNILITSLYGPIFDNINTLIIGKFYSPQILGSYTRAVSFVQFPSSNITGMVSRVSFPILSKLQDSPEVLRKSYRRLIKVTYFIVFPLMFGLLAVSGPLVKTILGDKWIECIPYLRVLCIAMSLYPLCAFNINVLLVTSHANLHMRLDLTKKIFTVVVLFATVPFGVLYICWGTVFTSLFSWVITAYFSGKYINLTLHSQIIDILPSLLNSTIMSIAVYLISFIELNSLIILIAQVVFGALLYYVLSRIFNNENLSELLSFVKIKNNEYN